MATVNAASLDKLNWDQIAQNYDNKLIVLFNKTAIIGQRKLYMI